MKRRVYRSLRRILRQHLIAPAQLIPRRRLSEALPEIQSLLSRHFPAGPPMELLAVIRALEALKRPCRVELHTDSNYVRDGITRWVHNWQKNGWRTSDRKPVKNAELWQELIDAAARHRIAWHWVKGHSGHPDNDRADALACAEADKQRLTHRL